MDEAEVEAGVGVIAARRIAEIQEIGAAILVYRGGKRAIESRSGIWNEPQAEKQNDEHEFRTYVASPSRTQLRDTEMCIPTACHLRIPNCTCAAHVRRVCARVNDAIFCRRQKPGNYYRCVVSETHAGQKSLRDRLNENDYSGSEALV